MRKLQTLILGLSGKRRGEARIRVDRSLGTSISAYARTFIARQAHHSNRLPPEEASKHLRFPRDNCSTEIAFQRRTVEAISAIAASPD